MVHPLPGCCPVCGEFLKATRLHCPRCDTTIEGHFALGRFHQLTPDQLRFAETFIRCAGKINKVQEELGISYPTVRARLEELIRALGFQVRQEAVPSTGQRKEILERLAGGEISAEEAIKLLKVGLP